jgi:putative transposon-encoded protein
MARTLGIEVETTLNIKNIHGFLRRKVTAFGNGAKVDCPKEYLGKAVYLVIIDGTDKHQ